MYGPIVTEHQVVPVDLDRLQGLLGELEAQWRRQKAPIAEVLAPGLSPAHAQRMTDEIGLRLPVEIQTWFAWHNGVTVPDRGSPSPEVDLGRGWRFLSIQQAVETYRSWLAAAQRAADSSSDLPADHWWPPSWLPLSHLDHGYVLVVDCDAPNGAVTPVRTVAWEDLDFHRIRTPSFTDAVAVWVQLLQRDLWSYNPTTKFWELDFDNTEMWIRRTGLL